MSAPSDPTNDVLRMALLAIAALVLAYGLFLLYSAAVTWTSLPTNPIVFLYFFIVLVVAPLLAARALILAWQGTNLRLAAILTAIPAAILLVRAALLGGA
jgi:hypothetical protein